MLDIKFIIENPGLIKKGAAKKHVEVRIDKIEELYNKRNEKLQQVESLRARQNKVSKEIPQASEPDKKKLLGLTFCGRFCL